MLKQFSFKHVVAVLAVVVLGMFFANSEAKASSYPGCGAPSGRACSEFFSRFQALKRLIAEENGVADAEGNLDMVEDAQKRLGLNLEYLTDGFVALQRAYGGSSGTVETRSIFSVVVDSYDALSQSVRFLDLVLTGIKAAQSENDYNDATANVRLIVNAVKETHYPLAQFERSFHALLGIVSNTDTKVAQAMFALIVQGATNFPIDPLTQSMLEMIRAENNHSEAIGNYSLVLQAARKCGDVRVANQDFTELLASVGGNGETSRARALYVKLYKL